jgi:hypothetical protein
MFASSKQPTTDEHSNKKDLIKQVLFVICITDDDDNFSLSSPHHRFYPPGTSSLES